MINFADIFEAPVMAVENERMGVICYFICFCFFFVVVVVMGEFRAKKID